jgi:hypothetical protein
MTCPNCDLPTDSTVQAEDGSLKGDHCQACRKEAAKAPKMADNINNAMERAGEKLRFTEDQVRQALLANRRKTP